MTAPLFLCFAVLGLLTGCGHESSNPSSNSGQQTNASSSSASPLTAPVDYLGALGKAQQSAIKTIDVSAVNQTIRQFQVEQGRLPKDLNELVQEKYLARIPQPPFGTKLLYDPETGEAKVVKQ
jgi:hypothetical protein